jgi:serine/threonine-protein kinase
VQRGWLTVYQANCLFQGRARDLVLGPYRILDRLGEGAVSQVFKAWDTRNRCVVALKVMHPGLLANPEAVARFQREMHVVAQLSHANIVKASDPDLEEDCHFFAMEYVEGTDLGKLVQLSGPLAVAQACDYICQAALGLQHAHERGLIHRDIKPTNLFLTTPRHDAQAFPAGGGQGAAPTMPANRFVLKILDMGLARFRQTAHGQPAVNVTREGMMIGTPDYLSPEQARDARAVDIRADIYSLGCTFYYLLTGQPPFPASTLMQKLLDHQKSEPMPIESLRPNVDRGVVAIVYKMMAKLPADRYQTPAEVAAELAPYCHGDSPAGGQAPAGAH